ncbi:MAG: PEP-CTERM sorting domain-containing protein [Planctomycetales bacterium]|nr:PEP-CTERM sorting domain-containing protein [Planctomycetales bacterium]
MLKQITNSAMVLGIVLVLAPAAKAALLSETATYSYSVAPGFSGGTFYLDDIHGSTLGQLNTPFAAGDLNDGAVHPNSNPTVGPANTMVAWDPTPLASTITFDLGGAFSISEVTVTTFAFSSFGLGTANDVTISYSSDNVSYSPGTLYSWADAGNGSNAHATGSAFDAARYVRLAFDGSTTTGDKWGLTEISIEGGAPIPEPSTALLLVMGLVGLPLRRSRRR